MPNTNMRKALVLIFTVFLFATAFAIDANTIELNVPSSVSEYPPEFNVAWDVNVTSTDWNYFVVAFNFVIASQSDDWYSADFNTGIDYSVTVHADDTNYCELNAEANVMNCSVEFNTAKLLRNGSVVVEVNGYKSDNNLIDSKTNTVQITSFSEPTASVMSYSSSGELNISVVFPCDVNASGTDVNGFVLHASGWDLKPDAVRVDKNLVTLKYENVTSIVRGALLELNTADVNAPGCNFAPDTNMLVVGLPDEYLTITASDWQPFVIPHEIDRNYSYTRLALNEVNAYVYFEGNHWVLQNPLDDDAYTLHAYLVYSDHNVYVPIRKLAQDPDNCSDVDYVQLSAGWSLLPVYCTNSQVSCADANSTLYSLSFVEFNASNAYVATHPFYAAIAEWNGDGFVPVTSFGSYTIQDGSAYWVWIPENWLQGGLKAYYYGRCVTPPSSP